MSIQSEIDVIANKYKSLFTAVSGRYEQKFAEMKENAPDVNTAELLIGLNFEVVWKRGGFKMDIPEVRMETEDFSFDIPEVRMETESLKFDVPAVRMVRKQIGKKPEFYMKKLKLTIKWTPIYGNMPEPYMKRVEIKTDIPVFNSKRVEVKFDIPKFTMETREFSFDYPTFRLTNAKAEIRNYEQEATRLGVAMEGEIKVLETEMQQELNDVIAAATSAQFDASYDRALSDRNKAHDSFEVSIASGKAAANRLRASGASARLDGFEPELGKVVEGSVAFAAAANVRLERISDAHAEALGEISVVRVG